MKFSKLGNRWGGLFVLGLLGWASAFAAGAPSEVSPVNGDRKCARAYKKCVDACGVAYDKQLDECNLIDGEQAQHNCIYLAGVDHQSCLNECAKKRNDCHKAVAPLL